MTDTVTYTGPERRSEVISKEALRSLFAEVIQESLQAHPLSEDEIQWVRLAIKAQADRAQLRRAFIEKSLIGFIYFCLAGLGAWALDYIAKHWQW